MANPRLTWLTKRPTGWSMAVPFVWLVAGLLFATSGRAAAGHDLRTDTGDLPDLIREVTRDNTESNLEVNRLRSEVDDLTAQAAPGNSLVKKLTAAADEVADPTGVTPVRGPAYRVTLDDSEIRADQLPEGFTVDDLVVHQQDVQAVVNALWAGGAEAMMIQDQRVISTSAVRCVGNTLILQGRVYSPPFVITAIGDVEGMDNALDFSPNVAIYRDYVAALGLGYAVERLGEREFPGYQGSLDLQYASPARGQDAASRYGRVPPVAVDE